MNDKDFKLGIAGLEDAAEVGRGGFAVVYRARQPAFDRTVAVKILTVSELDEQSRNRFTRECRAMGSLSHHPNIVTLHEAGFTPDGRAYLVMEYLSEGSLQDLMEGAGPMGWEEATRIGVLLAGAMETAHGAEVMHRDVKPANVLRSPFGEPKLTDFGIARIAGGMETKSGQITASVPFAPPEVLAGERPTSKGDVYSLAATIDALIRGKPAFHGDPDDSLVQVIGRVLHQPAPDLRPLGVPDEVRVVLEAGMAKAPAERPETAADFGRRLQAAQRRVGVAPTEMALYEQDSPSESGATIVVPSEEASIATAEPGAAAAIRPATGGVGAEPTEDPRATPPEPQRRRWWIAGVVGLGALAVAIAFLALSLSSSEPAATVALTTAPETSPATTEPTPATTSGTSPATTQPPPATTASPTTVTQPADPPILVETFLALGGAFATGTAPAGVDAGGNPITYDATNTIDGDFETAWRVPGDGIGHSVTVQLIGESTIVRVGLIPGYAKIDPFDGTDRFFENRGIQSVLWTFDGANPVIHDPDDVPDIEYIDVGPVTASSVTVEILQTSDHGGRDFAPISEIVVVGLEELIVEGEPAADHVFPLSGGVGDYSAGGHSYPATDIFAATGTEFVAVTSGVVDAVSRIDTWDPEIDDGATRGGLHVAIVGDDGVRYYGSHLSEVAVGIEVGIAVAVGQLLGLVGTTGSARNTPSHLHFGISPPTTPDDWATRRGTIDPVPFLDAWRSGDASATPDVGQ